MSRKKYDFNYEGKQIKTIRKFVKKTSCYRIKKQSYITYVVDLSTTTKIETLIVTVCWTEFHIKIQDCFIDL